MSFTHHDLNHWLHIKSDKKEHVVISLTVFQFAMGVSNIFIPILLYNIGYSLSTISLFYVFFLSIKLLMQLPTFDYINRHGVHHSLAMSYALGGFYILGIYIAQWHNVGLLLAGIFGGMHAATLWGSRHLDLVRVFAKKKISGEVSRVYILNALAAFLGPIVGGLVAEYIGPGYALLITFLGLMIATRIIHGEIYAEEQTSSKPLPPIHLRLPKRDYVANFFGSFSGVPTRVIWPLFVFVVVDSFSSVGFLFALATVASILLTKLVGKYNAKHGPHDMMLLGTLGRSLVSALRGFATNIGGVLAINLSDEASNAVRDQSYVSLYYSHAKSNSVPITYVRTMEISNNIAAILLWSSIFVLVPIYGDVLSLKVIFLFSAFAALMANLINHK